MKADRELYAVLVKAQSAWQLDTQKQVSIIALLLLASILYLVTAFISWSMVSFVIDVIVLAILFVVWVLMYRSWPKHAKSGEVS
jgi:VIT1/CCC1 family predicted Fe2+/Mn2+ transporter